MNSDSSRSQRRLGDQRTFPTLRALFSMVISDNCWSRRRLRSKRRLALIGASASLTANWVVLCEAPIDCQKPRRDDSWRCLTVSKIQKSIIDVDIKWGT